MSPRPKKRLGKKHRQASTRPKKGRAPRATAATGAQTASASPRKRKTLASKRAEQEKKRRTPTRSPERESRRTIAPKSGSPASLGAASEAAGAPSLSPSLSGDRVGDEEARAWSHAESLASGMSTDSSRSATDNGQRTTDNPSLPLIAICGRPNVGKSTLFNRLTGSRRSIVGDEPGITRDRIYGLVDWANREARLVDTGGIVPDDPDFIPAEIFRQAQTALTEADAIVMVIDGRTELASPDRDLARLLLRIGKPTFLAVNKIDTAALAPAAENFRRLGFANVFAISAEHGSGIGDLLDAVFESLAAVFATLPETNLLSSRSVAEGSASPTSDSSGAPALDSETWEGKSSLIPNEPHRAKSRGPHRDSSFPSEAEESAFAFPLEPLPSNLESAPERPRLLRSHGGYQAHETRIAIIGRPNVGKSTLLNALTGTDRAIVSPIAGTTRDAVDEVVTRNHHDFRFVDTAGIRRKGRTRLMAEKLSVVMARKHLEAADVSLLVLDATAGVLALDANIGGYAHESGRSVIIVVNKWDLVSGVPPNSSRGVIPTPQGSESPSLSSPRTPNLESRTSKKIYETQLRAHLKFLDYAPVVFLSAASGQGIEALFKKIELVARERRKRVTTGQMNRFLARLDFQHAPVPVNRRVKIYYMTQAAVAPPTFVLFTDRDVKLHFAFERFLANQIRAAFGFIGSPIWFKTRPRNKKSPAE